MIPLPGKRFLLSCLAAAAALIGYGWLDYVAVRRRWAAR